jgi:hypothetical protein
MAAAAGFTELAISADDAELAGGLDWTTGTPSIACWWRNAAIEASS